MTLYVKFIEDECLSLHPLTVTKTDVIINPTMINRKNSQPQRSSSDSIDEQKKPEGEKEAKKREAVELVMRQV
jgi:hypothetical protein